MGCSSSATLRRASPFIASYDAQTIGSELVQDSPITVTRSGFARQWYQLQQGSQREWPKPQTRMRNQRSWQVTDVVTCEQQVQVEHAWSPPFGANPSELVFDDEQVLDELRDARPNPTQQQRAVQVVGLRLTARKPHGRPRVQSRAALDFERLTQRTDGCSKRCRRVAEVTSEADDDPVEDYRRRTIHGRAW